MIQQDTPKKSLSPYSTVLQWSQHGGNSPWSQHKNQTDKKSITTTDKEYVEESYNLKTSRQNIMYTLFY